MKKSFATLAIFAVLGVSSYQIWFGATNHLIVYEISDPNSAICYQGKAEYYDGTCVDPKAPASQYLERIRQEEWDRQRGL